MSVSDTGLGISAEHISELFKPFNRLGAEFSGVEGTGIGLVITRQLVKLMQGELVVDSSFGQSSTFTVRLKSKQSEEVNSIDKAVRNDLSAEVPVPVPAAKLKILVAEDNPVNQLLLAAQMEFLGYIANLADNGVEAMKLWQTGKYQMLLTDIRMPEMDGYELIRAIRALESNTTASPIIAVTANAMESDIQRNLDADANAVISKPFSLDALQRMLEKWAKDFVTSD